MLDPTPPATSPATATDTATIAISDPTWTWRPSSVHLQPTWAPQPERKCGGRGAGDHACALAVDVAALLQLTAWVEKLDAINHMNGGEDHLIINIRSQAVGVLDAWTKRWYATHAMTDDAQRANAEDPTTSMADEEEKKIRRAADDNDHGDKTIALHLGNLGSDLRT